MPIPVICERFEYQHVEFHGRIAACLDQQPRWGLNNAKDSWGIEAYITNLSNTRGDLHQQVQL